MLASANIRCYLHIVERIFICTVPCRIYVYSGDAGITISSSSGSYLIFLFISMLIGLGT